MLKFDLVTRIVAAYPRLFRRDVKAIVAVILNTMAETLARGDCVELRDFCTLPIKRRDGREGCNPRTGETVSIAAKVVIQCRSGRETVRRLNPELPTRSSRKA